MKLREEKTEKLQKQERLRGKKVIAVEWKDSQRLRDRRIKKNTGMKMEWQRGEMRATVANKRLTESETEIVKKLTVTDCKKEWHGERAVSDGEKTSVL